MFKRLLFALLIMYSPFTLASIQVLEVDDAVKNKIDEGKTVVSLGLNESGLDSKNKQVFAAYEITNKEKQYLCQLPCMVSVDQDSVVYIEVMNGHKKQAVKKLSIKNTGGIHQVQIDRRNLISEENDLIIIGLLAVGTVYAFSSGDPVNIILFFIGAYAITSIM